MGRQPGSKRDKNGGRKRGDSGKWKSFEGSDSDNKSDNSASGCVMSVPEDNGHGGA